MDRQDDDDASGGGGGEPVQRTGQESGGKMSMSCRGGGGLRECNYHCGTGVCPVSE